MFIAITTGANISSISTFDVVLSIRFLSAYSNVVCLVLGVLGIQRSIIMSSVLLYYVIARKIDKEDESHHIVF